MDTNAKATFEVESLTQSALTYIIRLHGDGHWSCSCPHWQWRLSKDLGHCKHILQAMASAKRKDVSA